jgi:hypothetical protein
LLRPRDDEFMRVIKAENKTPLAIWFFVSLALVYFGFSLASIAHNSWGASLTWQRGERARLTATREGCALLGVILAAAIPTLFGLAWLSVLFSVSLLVCAYILLRYAPKGRHINSSETTASVFTPLRNRQFLSLLSVFAANGIAAAIPASLFLFFVSDRLQLASYAGLFLVLYFLAAACGLPLWAKLALKFGEAQAWLAAMALALLAFIWAANLVPGSLIGFGFVLSGGITFASIKSNPIADLYGWKLAGQKAAEFTKATKADGIAVQNWTLGSRAAWYAKPIPVFVLDQRKDQFDIWFGQLPLGANIVLINWSGMSFSPPVGSQSAFERCEPLDSLEIMRFDQVLSKFDFSLCSNWQGPVFAK